MAGVVDAGPAEKFAAEGVYDAFRNRGFFLVRRGGKLFALAALCTHRAARLKAEPDHTFYCERHGSKFSPDGHVTHGPARRDLPVFTTSVDAAGTSARSPNEIKSGAGLRSPSQFVC